MPKSINIMHMISEHKHRSFHQNDGQLLSTDNNKIDLINISCFLALYCFDNQEI